MFFSFSDLTVLVAFGEVATEWINAVCAGEAVGSVDWYDRMGWDSGAWVLDSELWIVDGWRMVEATWRDSDRRAGASETSSRRKPASVPSLYSS